MAAFRTILALAFLFLTVLQPGMFAVANAKGFQVATALAADASSVEHGSHAQHHQSVAEEPSQDNSSQNHHDKRFADKACEVHCASVTAVSVDCQALQRPVERCFEPVHLSVLIDGEYAELIRPPRRLN
ncbi:hypothetical protein [Mesorhizobium xinjiangense]|uniref:hypothetical protein n=1 Tax=Mesorhizobium xinjiangense TaxID=2678685 RepID=UPI0012ED00BF|nr:hypothetical protein [Mesorhizobium xinjiangense]